MRFMPVNTFKHSLTLFPFLVTFSLNRPDGNIERHLIRNGETIAFSNKPPAPGFVTSTSVRSGSYDGSGFLYVSDTGYNITLQEITPSGTPKQDDFHILGCTGKLTRNGNQLGIRFEKIRTKYYLINLDSASLAGAFDTIVRITLKAERPDGSSVDYYCAEKYSGGRNVSKTLKPSGKDSEKIVMRRSRVREHTTISLTAVPPGITMDEMSAALHQPASLAHFTGIEFEVGGGKVMRYPKGSYLLCEGNTFTLK
jgi:hypothetical protein